MKTPNQRKKSGRPTKAEEFRTFELGKAAIITQFGSEEEFWNFIAENALISNSHLKLLIEYTYGKAPSEINVYGELDMFTVPPWFKDLTDGGEDEEGEDGEK